MKKFDKKKGQAGQAIIEFLIVISLLLTLIFVFVQLSWAIAYGHYAHYATYMAARAYYSGTNSSSDQSDAANSVLASFLKTAPGGDLFPFLAKARSGDDRDIASGAEAVRGSFVGMHPTAEATVADGNIGATNRAYAWAEGVQYNFNVPLYMLPLAGWLKKEASGQNITGGTGALPTKAISWQGSIPFTSEAWLGREPTRTDCMNRMSYLSNLGFGRSDGATFIEDNGC